MASFRFSLQQVLDYRGQLEDQAKVHFAKAQTEYLTAQDHLRSYEAMLAEQEQALYDAVQFDPMDRWLREHYIKGLREDIRRTARLLIELSQAVETARELLIAASKERKVLDKLKEKQAQRHAHDESMQEQRRYDETASLRFKTSAF